MACKKSDESTMDKAVEVIEFQDHAVSLFTIAYDVISNIDSITQTSAFAESLQIVWIDSLFSDGNGIEAILYFQYYNPFSEKYLYGWDKKLRNGALHLIADNPISSNTLEGTISTLDSVDFLSGYNHQSMRHLSGSVQFKRLLAKEWLINFSQMQYKSETHQGNMNFKGSIVFESDTTNNLWGNTLILTGNAEGTLQSEFHSEITKPLIYSYSKSCSGMFKEGQQKLQFGTEEWFVDYNAFGNDNCDRYIKLTLGRKEYFKSMY